MVRSGGPRRRDDDRYRGGVRVEIVVFDGVDEMDAIGPLEVFRSAGSMGENLTAHLVTRTPTEMVHGAYGLSFVPDDVFVAGRADVVVVAGGGWSARSDRGAWGEVQRGDWLPLLREARTRSRLLAGVCTGSLLLAHAGLLEGRRANTHHLAQGDLRSLGVTVVDERVVDDGDVVSSGGVTSGIDLALWIVERELSPATAERIATRMEYHRFVPNSVAGVASGHGLITCEMQPPLTVEESR